ncbi:MAG: hypothetical protein NTX25_12615 [Proteobacteria bacterium]|nr:hypothetical protein [Pseudomonadota bacterium]
MYKFLTLILLAWSSLSWALNGLRPIGVSAESNAMGGTGVSTFYNYYDALYKNPALMATAPGRRGQSQAVFGMTYGSFLPKVKATYGEDQDYKKPVNSTSAVFPSSIGYGQRVFDRISMAVGVYGGGGGADYGEKADSVYRARSKTMTFSLTSGLSWAFTPATSIGINGSISSVDTHASNLSITKGTITEIGGRAQTFGTLVGVRHQIDQLSFGAIYQPRQTAFLPKARDIDDDGIKDNLLFTAVPTEYAAGISWQDTSWALVADYRYLEWSKAEFLKSVGWQDQQVLALGFEYGRQHRIRLGYNVSTSAINDKASTDGFGTTTVSQKPLINLAADAFATTSGLGVTDRHYTIGSSHILNQDIKINSAYVYMEPGTLERSGQYNVPTGKKVYGWKSEFAGSTFSVDLTYLW